MNRKINIYVSTSRFQDATTGVVNNFVTDVTTLGGTTEAPSCMFNYLEELGGISGIINSSEKLELFNDEQISVSSTQQNVADISKTYTDFSQSFTIPASTHNNKIIQHFYQSDVNSLIDYNLRLDSFIEIELNFFRRGKIQIEKANLQNGKPESYTLTFYGEGRTLLDYFGEDMLSDLDYTPLNHLYTGAEVKTRITNTTNTYDVKYPLISSNRIWTYQGTSPTSISPTWLTIPTSSSHDIHHTSGHIHHRELFPALRVRKIFDRIAAKYGITFNGNFLSDDRFTKLFLYYKNRNEMQIMSESYLIDMQSAVPAFISYDLSGAFDTTLDTLNITSIPSVLSHLVEFNVTSASTGDDYYIDVYQNGNLLNTIIGNGVGTYTCDFFNETSGLDVTYQFKIRASFTMTIASTIKYSVQYISSGVIATDYATCTNASQSIILNTDLASMAPVMKVSDFFSGVLKVFNMTCYSTGVKTFQVEPLDDWYAQGAIVNITEYTDVNSIDVDRMKLHKKITMKYQNSESFLNKQFSQLFNREYGNTTYQYNYDGDEFTLDVPFENLLQTKFTGTNLQVGYALNNEFAPYVPKPVLLYQYDNQTTDFKFNDGTSTSTITNYTPFGQDLYTNLTNYTLNFAPDISTILNVPVQQTLFGTYYFSYLYNLYNLKQRLITVKTILPISLLTGLKLNDRLIIRDKRYIINSMQSNLTTGEVNFQLVLDFRPMINKTIQPYIGIAGGVVSFGVNFVNNAVSALLTSTNSDVTFSPSTLDSSQVVQITLPSGTAGTVYEIITRFTLANGDTELQTAYIIQK
jgi:hypothetical protein